MHLPQMCPAAAFGAQIWGSADVRVWRDNEEKSLKEGSSTIVKLAFKDWSIDKVI